MDKDKFLKEYSNWWNYANRSSRINPVKQTMKNRIIKKYISEFAKVFSRISWEYCRDCRYTGR